MLVSVGEWHYAEILPVIKLVMATFFVIENHENSAELRALYPLMLNRIEIM